jgi:hypothetical protein
VAAVTNWEGNPTEPAVNHVPAIVRFLGYAPYRPGALWCARLAATQRSLRLSEERLAGLLGVDGHHPALGAGPQAPGESRAGGGLEDPRVVGPGGLIASGGAEDGALPGGAGPGARHGLEHGVQVGDGET